MAQLTYILCQQLQISMRYFLRYRTKALAWTWDIKIAWTNSETIFLPLIYHHYQQTESKKCIMAYYTHNAHSFYKTSYTMEVKQFWSAFTFIIWRGKKASWTFCKMFVFGWDMSLSKIRERVIPQCLFLLFNNSCSKDPCRAVVWDTDIYEIKAEEIVEDIYW